MGLSVYVEHMQIGYILSPQTDEGGAQPMSNDPPTERRLTVAEAKFADDNDLRDLEVDRWSWPEGVFPDKKAEFALLDEYNLNVVCVGLWGKRYMDSAVGEQAEAELERALEYAGEVEPSVFVTGTEVPAELGDDAAWDEGLAYYGELLDHIQSHGYDVAFYFGHGENPLLGYDLEEMRRFTEALPAAKLKVDPANLLFGGLDPKRVLYEFGDRVGHFHIKDGLQIEIDGEPTVVDQPPAGMGDVPWGNLIDLLYLNDYDGALCIEPHGSYWGHVAANEPRRAGIKIAQQYVSQILKPADRPTHLQ